MVDLKGPVVIYFEVSCLTLTKHDTSHAKTEHHKHIISELYVVYPELKQHFNILL